MPAGHPLLLALPALFLVAGCVTQPDTTATPRLARLAPEEMARLTPAAPGLSLDDLLLMARSGASAEAIILRFRQSAVRFDLTPLQVVDLHQRGLPLAVLVVIHEDREKALRSDLAQRFAEHDQQCRAELAQVHIQEQQRCRANIDPFWPGGYRRPGAFWGW